MHGPAELIPGNALLFCDELVEQEEQRRRRVDRHRGRDLTEWDRVEEELHVRNGVDRHAGAADLSDRARVVRVVAKLRRKIERDRKTHLAALEQMAEALVRLLRGCETGVLANRPRPPAIHVRVGAPRIRELTRELELRLRVVGRVDRLDLDAGVGFASLGRRHIRIVRSVPRGRPFGGGTPEGIRPHRLHADLRLNATRPDLVEQRC